MYIFAHKNKQVTASMFDKGCVTHSVSLARYAMCVTKPVVLLWAFQFNVFFVFFVSRHINQITIIMQV